MGKQLSFLIDKLTNSIEDAYTGKNIKTLVLPLAIKDLKAITKKAGWNFNWRQESKKKNIQLYKLIAKDDPGIIHGLVSCEMRDNYYRMELIESALFNIGHDKKYIGVPGNLVAHICKLSFEAGFDGVVDFTPKTILKEHYKLTLSAEEINK